MRSVGTVSVPTLCTPRGSGGSGGCAHRLGRRWRRRCPLASSCQCRMRAHGRPAAVTSRHTAVPPRSDRCSGAPKAPPKRASRHRGRQKAGWYPNCAIGRAAARRGPRRMRREQVDPRRAAGRAMLPQGAARARSPARAAGRRGDPGARRGRVPLQAATPARR